MWEHRRIPMQNSKPFNIHTLSPRRWSVTPYFLSVGCTQWLPPREYNMGREGKVTWQWRNLINNLSHRQKFKFTSIVTNHANNIHPQCDVWEWHFISMVVFPQTHNPASKHEKNTKFQLRTTLQNSWPILLKIVKLSKLTKNIWETVIAKRNLKRLDR